MLSESEKKFLLELARKSIAFFLEKNKKMEVDPQNIPASLQENRACFVTLTKDFELRGCMGTMEATQPLYREAIDNALAAAFEDERFFSVTKDELSYIEIEISVLTETTPLIFSNPEDLLSKLRVGVDGVVLKKGGHEATFLPQVWDELLDKKEFLVALCVKAGLPPSAWMDTPAGGGLEVWVYQVEVVADVLPPLLSKEG